MLYYFNTNDPLQVTSRSCMHAISYMRGQKHLIYYIATLLLICLTLMLKSISKQTKEVVIHIQYGVEYNGYIYILNSAAG